jgi:hypothetical protein
MNCHDVQEWLLRSDLSEHEPVPADAAAHLGSCTACRQFADRLRRLEKAVRELPAPEGIDAAREAFLRRLGSAAAGRQPPRFPVLLRRAGWMAAAAVLVAAGVGVLVMTAGGSRTSEASVVLDALIDWNLDMSNVNSRAERDQIYAARAKHLDDRVSAAAFSLEERELAASLLENGVRLVHTDDPLAEAEGFTDVAFVLVRQMGATAATGDVRKTKRLSNYYSHVKQHGIDAKIRRFHDATPLLPERDRFVEKILKRNDTLREQLALVLEGSPTATREEIRRALDLPSPKRRQPRGK